MPDKLDIIQKAIARENPNLTEGQTWAIAQAAYNKYEKKKKEEYPTKAAKAAKRSFKNYVR